MPGNWPTSSVDPFFAGLATRTEEVKRRYRTVLQAKADAVDAVHTATAILRRAAKAHVDSTVAVV